MVWDELTPLQGRTAVYRSLALKCSGVWATVGYFSKIWMWHKESALCKQNLDSLGDRKLENDGKALK